MGWQARLAIGACAQHAQSAIVPRLQADVIRVHLQSASHHAQPYIPIRLATTHCASSAVVMLRTRQVLAGTKASLQGPSKFKTQRPHTRIASAERCRLELGT